MTPDTCPHCGAELLDEVPGHWRQWGCSTVEYLNVGAPFLRPSPECARYVRTRISQLKRMAESCEVRFDRWCNGYILAEERFPEWWIHRRHDQYRRVAAACLREINRLRGGA